jgi:hypothetical protein
VGILPGEPAAEEAVPPPADLLCRWAALLGLL